MTKLTDPVFKNAHMHASHFHKSILEAPVMPVLSWEPVGGEDGVQHPPLFAGAELQMFGSLVPSSSSSRVLEESQSIMDACRTMQENLCVHALPECVSWAQSESLARMHGACTSRLEAARRMSFCAVCAINGKGFQCKLRMCCMTGQLSCVACQQGLGKNAPLMLLNSAHIFSFPINTHTCTRLQELSSP